MKNFTEYYQEYNMINIDYKKYKRFFVFGCSFTSYIWPTWADILSKEMPQAEYYNFGLCGGGNLFIAASVAEANQRFNFNENDLVVIMWTTVCREDRYITNRGWLMTGNIFTQQEYDQNFVEKFADTRGYLIRDLAIISLTVNLFKSLPATAIFLSGVPFNYQNENVEGIESILTCYQNIIDQIKPSLLKLEMNMVFTNGHEYFRSPAEEIWKDYHPDCLRYYMYLQKLGFPLGDKTYQYALDSFKKLKSCQQYTEIMSVFNEELSAGNKRYLMF